MTAYEKVRQVLIEEMNVEADCISPEASLVDLEMDSLDTAFFITALENAFACDVLEDDFQKLRTVGEVAEYAEKRQVVIVA